MSDEVLLFQVGDCIYVLSESQEQPFAARIIEMWEEKVASADKTLGFVRSACMGRRRLLACGG